jgi:hypothetical protein
MSSVTTPLDPNVVLTKKVENEEEDMDVKHKDYSSRSYAEHIGALIWLATICRPDISFAVSRVGAYSANPSQAHWTAVKRIFRYLKGTRDLRLTFGGLLPGTNIANTFGAYSDADFASNPDDRKSVSGYVYMLGGGAIAWHSKKQATTATSTTKAEYSALAAAAREAIWLSNLFNGLEVIDFENPTLIYSDNQAAIIIARDPQHHSRTKHFDVQNHFVREKVELGTIEVEYCPTDEMVADIFTKALPRVKFEKFRQELGLLPA